MDLYIYITNRPLSLYAEAIDKKQLKELVSIRAMIR